MRDFIFIDTCALEEAGFCTDCNAIDTECGFTYCPSEFDMLDEACIRSSDVEEIRKELDSINARLSDICESNCRLGGLRDM